MQFLCTEPKNGDIYSQEYLHALIADMCLKCQVRF